MGSSLGLSEPSLAGLSSFVGGAAAAAAAQSITVPVDVISQRCAAAAGAGCLGLALLELLELAPGQPLPHARAAQVPLAGRLLAAAR
jgi:hypothetical protein